MKGKEQLAVGRRRSRALATERRGQGTAIATATAYCQLRLVILGPPGSGKGTQAERIASQYKIHRISSGDLLRKGIKEGTELGKKAKATVEKGALVPDSLMLDLIRECLEGLRNGFILDGFPRTLQQGKELEGMLNEGGTPLSGVLSLEVEEKVLVERLTRRRICSHCGALFNLLFSPPREEGKCDRCGGSLIQREDDREETVRRRLMVYEKETSPLKEFYRGKSLLHPVGGEGEIQDVGIRLDQRIQKILYP